MSDIKIVSDSGEYLWKPKDDITAAELAGLLPFFLLVVSGKYSEMMDGFDAMSPEMKRHFEEMK